MSKIQKIIIRIIGILLILTGVLNIIDDARILTYDITSILSGIGFVLLCIFIETKSKIH